MTYPMLITLIPPFWKLVWSTWEETAMRKTNLAGPDFKFPSTPCTLKTQKQTFLRQLFSLQTGKPFPQTRVPLGVFRPLLYFHLCGFFPHIVNSNRLLWRAARPLKGNSISSGLCSGSVQGHRLFSSIKLFCLSPLPNCTRSRRSTPPPPDTAQAVCFLHRCLSLVMDLFFLRRKHVHFVSKRFFFFWESRLLLLQSNPGGCGSFRRSAGR